ncbi:Ankyrin-2 [Echinococcus granulosus]|uniref:Ankyrin-2 n=1 Tax=Echinococcus granulosus TaxID=6210 RepID=W6UT43_ECHGR|nr:Ankyrin-2 [Echinococcus granulosus]EUB63876.1 Ankyrin-2 [Echinococcus granulosus]
MIHEKTPASTLKRGSQTVERKPRRSASFTACFPIRKSIRQWEREDLLERIQRNSNRRCFTLPPIFSRNYNVINPDDIPPPPTSIATVRETDQPLHTRNFPLWMHLGQRGPRKQTEPKQGFLRAARSGNIGKIAEYLNSNVDINAVSSAYSQCRRAASPKPAIAADVRERRRRLCEKEQQLTTVEGEICTMRQMLLNGLNALHLASKEGHLPVVRLLLDHHATIDAKTNRGNTALHIASLAGRSEIVRLLVERGADVNAKSQNGFTPLYMAAQENHTEIVEYLLNKGADQALATDDGFTPLAVALQLCHDAVVSLLLERDSGGKGRLPALHVAAKKDDVHAVSLLLANNDVNVNHASARGFTPLHIAARYGNLKVARLLINNGAEVNCCAKDSITPLHLSAKWGKVEMTQLLIDKGAQLDARTRDGLTPMHTAARSGHTNVVQVLLNAGASITAKTRNGLSPLHMAAQSDHADTAKLLLKKGSPPDDVTMDYLTPLHIAAHCGNMKVAQVLLDHRCDPNLRAFVSPPSILASFDTNGFTPLHIACKKMTVKIVELLLKKGAIVDATTQAGLTPLHAAAFVGCSDAAAPLLQRGANVNQVTMRGETPLHFAVRGRHVDTIKLLLKHSASVNAKAKEKATPLHIALRLMDSEIVKLLIEAGADVQLESRGKHRPIHLAAKVGDIEIIRLLLEKGAQVNAGTKRGYTALHIATKYGKIDAVRYLVDEAKADANAAARNGLTPLHVSIYYQYPQVVEFLLSRGADVTAKCKNGFTPLHLAAKANTPEIATLLIKANAPIDCVSQNGYSPLHLASMEGNFTVVRTLVDDYSAQVNCSANDGLTPLHLATQVGRVDVAEFLLAHGASQNIQTRNGYMALHEAAYRGSAPLVRLLLAHPGKEGAINSRTIMGCTPLHLAAQQGHSQIVDLLLNAGADLKSRTMQGWTAAQVAKRQHYPSIFESLSRVTTTVSDWDTPSLEGASADGLSQGDPALVDGSMILDSPTQMLDRVALVESEDESECSFSAFTFPSSVSVLSVAPNFVNASTLTDRPRLWFDLCTNSIVVMHAGDQLVSTPVIMRHHPRGQRKASAGELSLFKSPSYNLLCKQMEYTRAHKGEPKIRISALDSTMEEQTRVSELMRNISNRFQGTSTLSVQKSDIEMSGATPLGSSEWEAFEAEPIQAVCKPVKAGFLVSFLVDARGGFVEAQRRPNLRFLIPPHAISSPTRIICRLLRPDRVSRLPHLNDGDAIIEMSPSSVRLDGPILLEVPYFASIQGRDREVITLRCDHGDSWKAHPLEATDQSVQDALGTAFGQIELLKSIRERRIQRILTVDVPRFFALISRFRQEIALIGPDGGVLASTVSPKVQAVFPKGALQKRIKVGLQVGTTITFVLTILSTYLEAQVIQPYVVNKMVGNRAAFSPVVTLEPRRRKFHKPITVTIPLPRQSLKGVHKSDPLPPSLHLLCSITAGCAPATWEDITGSTTMTRHKDCISFTTTVSARLWLVDAQGIEDVAEMASRVYQESIIPPYIGRFAVYARLPEDRQEIEANEAAASISTSAADAISAATSVASRFRRKVFHPADAELRCICLIDDAPEKTLEQHEKFQLVAVSESKTYWLETVGDISSYPAHTGQLTLDVQAFQENRLTYPVRVRQPVGTKTPPTGHLRVYREPQEAYGARVATDEEEPITVLEIHMPGDAVEGRWLDASTSEEVSTKAMRPELNIREIALRTNARWPQLAKELGLSPEDIKMVERELLAGEQIGQGADSERCQHMLALWMQRSAAMGTLSPEDLASRMREALQKLGVHLDDRTAELDVQPVTSRVHHIDEEMTSSKTPSLVHSIQMVSAITPQHTPPPLPLIAADHVITAPIAAEAAVPHPGSESPTVPTMDQTPPPTAVDGTPRTVPSEEVPYILTSSIKSASLERPLSMVASFPSSKDGLGLPTDEIKPVSDEFIVASESLTRKNLLPPEEIIVHADSVARQIAAEELVEALGLDSDVHMISVISQSADHEDLLVTEAKIEPVKSKPKQEISPLMSRAAAEAGRAETPVVGPTDTLHIEADDELRVPSMEQLDNADEDFEAAYRAAAAEGTPSPTGLAGHDVHQGRPEEGFLIEEMEEVLPDGTVVKQRVQTAETIQALSAHDWEEAVFNAAAAGGNDQYIIEPPEEVVKVEEVEETLADGIVVKKRITTQHITERITEREVTDEVSENELLPNEADGGVVEWQMAKT